eukprot:364429-Chlamydomonas_euryale.AAC.24
MYEGCGVDRKGGRGTGKGGERRREGGQVSMNRLVKESMSAPTPVSVRCWMCMWPASRLLLGRLWNRMSRTPEGRHGL